MMQQQGNEFDLGKTLIYCLQNVTTSSVNNRNEIVRQLFQCIECQGNQCYYFSCSFEKHFMIYVK